MSDQDVDEPLARTGPALDGHRAGSEGEAARRYHRARRWLAVAATVAVVAGGAAVAAWLGGSSHGAQLSSPPGVPSMIVRGGNNLRYAGDEPWRDPVLAENRPDVVFVYSTPGGGTASWGSYCESTLIARVVSQTARTVRVAMAKYARPPAGDACASIGVGPTRISVTLTRPLGTRELVDAEDGAVREVLDPATVLKPSYLPPGYTGGQATWADEPATATTRRYEGAGAGLIITVGPAPAAATGSAHRRPHHGARAPSHGLLQPRLRTGHPHRLERERRPRGKPLPNELLRQDPPGAHRRTARAHR